MKSIRAVYENGVFRPSEPVDLPEGSEVVVVLQLQRPDDLAPSSPHLGRIYSLLSEPEDTGDPHLSGRHDLHQP